MRIDQINMGELVEYKPDRLKRYRTQQRFKALERDNFECVVCRFLSEFSSKADEVHHVYGRGNWRTRKKYEHYSNLLSICNRHHHDYHFVKRLTNKKLMIQCLDYANNRDRFLDDTNRF